MGQPHYAQVLKDLEAKNPALLAAAKQAEAQKAAAHAGLLLDDPEVEAAYYWGDPSENGVRWDLRVSQSFEMPSVLVRRARLRDLQENAAGLDYQALRVATLLETQQLCADIIYYWNIALVYDRHCTAAIRLAQLYQRRFESGDCSILEYNRAQMNMADIQNKAGHAVIEAHHVMEDLRWLMGDENYQFSQREYDSVWPMPYFEAWYEQVEMRNPKLQQLDNQPTERAAQSCPLATRSDRRVCCRERGGQHLAWCHGGVDAAPVEPAKGRRCCQNADSCFTRSPYGQAHRAIQRTPLPIQPPCGFDSQSQQPQGGLPSEQQH